MNGFLGHRVVVVRRAGRKVPDLGNRRLSFAIDSPSTVPGGYLSLLYERPCSPRMTPRFRCTRGRPRPGEFSTVCRRPYSGSRRNTYHATNDQSNVAQQSKIDSLNEFANMTGGKAFYNTNDLATSFKRAADDASSYYLLGYYLNTRTTVRLAEAQGESRDKRYGSPRPQRILRYQRHLSPISAALRYNNALAFPHRRYRRRP